MSEFHRLQAQAEKMKEDNFRREAKKRGYVSKFEHDALVEAAKAAHDVMAETSGPYLPDRWGAAFNALDSALFGANPPPEDEAKAESGERSEPAPTDKQSLTVAPTPASPDPAPTNGEAP